MLVLTVPPSPLAVADEVIEWAAKIFVVLHMSAMAQSCWSRLLVRQPISRWLDSFAKGGRCLDDCAADRRAVLLVQG
jgi:hypothetical protein